MTIYKLVCLRWGDYVNDRRVKNATMYLYLLCIPPPSYAMYITHVCKRAKRCKLAISPAAKSTKRKLHLTKKKKKKNAKMEVPFSETKRISCGVNSIAEVIISKLH